MAFDALPWLLDLWEGDAPYCVNKLARSMMVYSIWQAAPQFPQIIESNPPKSGSTPPFP